MFITKVCIKNFRVFGNEGVEFIFNKGVNAIIGENNSGKTALLDAIRIAFSFVEYSNKDIYFSRNDFHVNQEGKRAQSSCIDIYLADVPEHLIDLWNPESNDGEFHLKFYTVRTPSGIDRVKGQIWGGKSEGNTLTPESLEAIHLSFLGALRDAENEMRPSRSSRLAKLLEAIVPSAESRGEFINVISKANKQIMDMEHLDRAKSTINKNLHDIEQDLLQQNIDIGFIEPKFESIISALKAWIVPRWVFVCNDSTIFQKIVIKHPQSERLSYIKYTTNGLFIDAIRYINEDHDDEEINTYMHNFLGNSFELYQNGLGYNNIIFMSTVLGDMSTVKDEIFLNILLIEEPEAHLHPQLQELIHNFFLEKYFERNTIQVIYTSHSPTLVSKIGIEGINLLYESEHSIKCFPLANLPLDDTDRLYLEKYLDVTKSQLFFAKGIIFVEGICEAILLPEFGKLLDRNFDKFAVEVVNIDGTAFKPFANLLSVTENGDCFAKAAIITDDDRCTNKSDSKTYIPRDIDFDDDISEISSRIEEGAGSERFENIKNLCLNKKIEFCYAKKTLEYELALRENNIPYILNAIIAEFPQVGSRLKTLVDAEASIKNKALRIWLFIRSRNSCKGQFAQSLMNEIKKYSDDKKNYLHPFTVPEYIKNAIYSVTDYA